MMKSEHNSFPYNDTEWNNIVNDAFTSDAQPHVFRNAMPAGNSRCCTRWRKVL